MSDQIDFDWLDETRTYWEDLNEAYLYIGTPSKVRTSIIKVSENQFEQPVRIPQVSKNNLDLRHAPQSPDLVRTSNLSVKCKYIINLIERKFENIKFMFNEEEIANLIYTPDKYQQRINVNKILFGAAITEKQKNWLKGRKINTSTGFDYFIRIISRPCRYSRQVALTGLVNLLDEKNMDALSFLLLLFGLNEEITISIIRELGRQQKFVEPVIQVTRYYLKDGINNNTVIKWYSFLYLFAYDVQEVNNHPLYKIFITEGVTFTALLLADQWKNIANNIYKEETIKNAFLGCFHLAEHDLNKFHQLINLIINNLLLDKKSILSLRRALMHILKIIEIIPNPRIAGLILSIVNSKQSLEIIKIRKVPQKITIYKGPLHFHFTYIIRRLGKLFEVWNYNGMQKLTDEALFIYTQHISIKKVTRNTESLSREVIKEWIDNLPLLNKYQTRILTLFEENKIWLFQTLKIHAEGMNVFVLEWIDNSLKTKIIEDALSLANLDELLAFYVLRLPKKLKRILKKKITIEEFPIFTSWSQRPDVDYQFDRVLSFFTQIKQFMPAEIFEKLLELHFNNLDLGFQEIIDYISIINHNANFDQSRQYLQIIFEFIKKFAYDHLDDPRIKTFCIDFVLNWEKITFHKLDEKDEDKIDSIRIVFEKYLDTNKPNTWDIISVETITAVYEMQKKEIGSFMNAAIHYAMNKPNWEQIARHFLALGLERPNREALLKSKLKDLPRFLLRDIEGQIALISETIKYCERNGFSPVFENLIIQNIYKRGWNIDRNIARKLPSLFGNISIRLRSYFGAYLILDQNEVSLDILKLAKDIDNYQLRERLVKSLVRFGTPDMWLVLIDSIHDDLSTESLKQLQKARYINNKEKNKFALQLLGSVKQNIRKAGLEWLDIDELELQDLLQLTNTPFPNILTFLLQQLIKRSGELTVDNINRVMIFLNKLLWKTNTTNIQIDLIKQLLFQLKDLILQKPLIIKTLQDIVTTSNTTRRDNLSEVFSIILR